MPRQQDVLFMAQLPPPYHGQSVVSGAVHQTLIKICDANVTHLWKGGAKSSTDVGKRSIRKYLRFAQMVLILVYYLVSFRRFEIAYLGVAPWAHTISRDAILMFLAKRVANRVMVHIHGDGMQKYLNPKSNRERMIAACFSNTELIAITKALGLEASRSGHFSTVHHLPNFAPEAKFETKRARKTIHLGMVSNLDSRKGVFEFVETLRQLKANQVAVKGTIVGGSTAELSAEKLSEHVSDAGLDKIITVTGRVSEEEKHRLLSDFNIFLYPSRHDLSPLSMIEAIAHGCVPVVLDTGGIPEIVGPDLADNVFSSSLDLEGFSKLAATRIEDYSTDKVRLKNDAKLAHNRFLETFSEARFSASLQGIVSGGDVVSADPKSILAKQEGI